MAVGDSRWCSNMGSIGVVEAAVDAVCAESIEDLIARDRGYTHPDCHVPGYLCQAHHITEWAHDGPTDIDNLTFACTPAIVSSTTAGPPETPQRHHPMDTPTTVNAGGGRAADPVLLDWEAGPRAASIL